MRVSLPHFLIGYQVLPLKANSLVSNNYPEASVVSTAWNTIATSTLSWLLISYFLLLISQSIQGCPFLVFFPWFCGRVSWSRWTSNPLSSQGWSSTLDPPVSSQVLGLDYRVHHLDVHIDCFYLVSYASFTRHRKPQLVKAQGASSLTDVTLHRVGNEEGHGRFIGSTREMEGVRIKCFYKYII